MRTAVCRQRLSELALVSGKKLTPRSYCVRGSLLSGSIHCKQDGFALGLLAGKGDLKGDSSALEVNSS